MRLSSLLVSVVFLCSFLTGSAFAASYWEVIMTGATGDTIWVRAEPQYEYGPPCGGGGGGIGMCYSYQGTILNVAPCPLSVPCGGAAYQTEIAWNFYPQVTLALRAGVQYTFSGNAVSHLEMEQGWWDDFMQQWILWCMPVCDQTITFDPIVFGSPVAVKPQTWGGIKALFR